MDSFDLLTKILFIIFLLFSIGLYLSFWMLSVKVLEKLNKFLDLKILESEIKIDKF